MNEEKEATWILIHAKVCKLHNHSLTMPNFNNFILDVAREELQLLREQMPKLLEEKENV